MVRILQNILIVFGVTVLVIVLGFNLTVMMIAASQQRQGEEPMARGFGQMYGGLFCGLPLSGFVGLVASIVWIRARPGKLWHPIVWLGILFSLMTSAWCYSVEIVHAEMFGWLEATLVTISCGTVGGMLASIVVAVIGIAKSKPEDKGPM